MTNPFLKTNCFAKYADVKSHLVIGSLEAVPYPTISVIMPVYRGGKFFELALNSVLNQDYTAPFEVIIVDNNPYSEGLNSIQDLVGNIGDKRILYYRNDKNIGMFPNWNRGIELSRSSYITFCHEDDKLLPNALTTLMDIQHKTGNKMIYTRYNVLNSQDECISHAVKQSTRYRFINRKSLYNYNLIDVYLDVDSYSIGCLYGKKELVDLGGFDQDDYPSGDWALNSAYTHYIGAVKIISPTFEYRIAENESYNIWPKFGESHYDLILFSKSILHIPGFIINWLATIKKQEIDLLAACGWGKMAYEKATKPSKLNHSVWKFMQMLRVFHNCYFKL